MTPTLVKTQDMTPITVNVTTAGNSNVNATEKYRRKKGNQDIGIMPSNVKQLSGIKTYMDDNKIDNCDTNNITNETLQHQD